jgi:hypothetical protein
MKQQTTGEEGEEEEEERRGGGREEREKEGTGKEEGRGERRERRERYLVVDGVAAANKNGLSTEPTELVAAVTMHVVTSTALLNQGTTLATLARLVLLHVLGGFLLLLSLPLLLLLAHILLHVLLCLLASAPVPKKAAVEAKLSPTFTTRQLRKIGSFRIGDERLSALLFRTISCVGFETEAT